MPVLARGALLTQPAPDMPPPSPIAASDWPAYLRVVRQHADRRMLLSLLVVIGLGLVEVSGLALLLPLLSIVGVPQADPTATGLIHKVQAWSMHLPFIGLLGIFLGLVVIQTLAKLVLSRLSTRLRVNFTRFLWQRLHDALIAADWSVFLRLRGSDIVRAFTGEVTQAAGGLAQLVSLASSLVLALVQIVVALILSPVVTLIALGVGAVVVLVTRPLARHAREESERSQVDRGALAANITDHVAGLKIGKSHAAEGRHAAVFNEVADVIGRRQMRMAELQARSRARFNLIAAFSLCLVLGYAVQFQHMRGAELIVMAILFTRLVGRMMSLQAGTQRLAFVFPAFHQIEALRNDWIESAETPPDPTAPALTLRNRLRLTRVHYRYPQADRPALNGVSLDLPAGKTTALCGHSGAGKSTLADLVLGLIAPTAGNVTVDGTPLTGAAVRSWRLSVAYVPQDVFLFNDTIRENLHWLSPDATEDELWRALEDAAAADLVRRLPQGLDTIVGDRGVRLSGGERQRLALARAMLRNPSLLVLDEATSALDHANEQLIRTAIERLHGTMTILIIAHRLSTIRHADQIVVLETGRIVQSGSWHELAADENKPFAQMIAGAAI